MNQISTDQELDAFFAEEDTRIAAEKAERVRLEKLSRVPFEHAKFNFKLGLYRKAIAA